LASPNSPVAGSPVRLNAIEETMFKLLERSFRALRPRPARQDKKPSR
jgi:hypothetical protein